MMKNVIMAFIAAASFVSCTAQDIALPSPDMNQKSQSTVEALATRHSVREYDPKALNNQELSNLCWAANGVSRDSNHRTAPSAMNRKEIRLFVFTADNVYEYMAVENKLRFVVAGDQRALIAGGKSFSQDFVKEAPVSLLMVIDFDIYGSQDEHAIVMGSVDAGNVSENINLYCQSVGLATVPRASMDVDGLRTLLGLSNSQLPVMNNPVGYPKK
ncbi:MAG: SagB/ThcOx family dehydrogenase [Bacteroidales bacterium]|nr:SagB/ThcOx family dehydrogenase [Bacteroidales bacterium]